MTQQRSILVSACLLGTPCRYDGKAQPCAEVLALAEGYELVSVCPEQLGGLPTPRTPSEVQADGRVVDRAGSDRTAAFERGAQAAVELARETGCTLAVLKSRSPSCGVHQVYDGTFSGTVVPGRGIAAAALAQAGLQIIDETEVARFTHAASSGRASMTALLPHDNREASAATPFARDSQEETAGRCPPDSPAVRAVVITGGPCAGKTSALGVLKERIENAGIPTFVVPEAATDLILRGTAPWTCTSMLAFQTQVIALQLQREAHAWELARATAANGHRAMAPVVICDRGICDSHAYLNDEDYRRALEANALCDNRALSRYDAVFHLSSIAKDDLSAYTKANNEARFENADEAVAADDRVLSAWSAHPHRFLVGNEATFEQKADNLAATVLQFLGEPHAG